MGFLKGFCNIVIPSQNHPVVTIWPSCSQHLCMPLTIYWKETKNKNPESKPQRATGWREWPMAFSPGLLSCLMCQQRKLCKFTWFALGLLYQLAPSHRFVFFDLHWPPGWDVPNLQLISHLSGFCRFSGSSREKDMAADSGLCHISIYQEDCSTGNFGTPGKDTCLHGQGDIPWGKQDWDKQGGKQWLPPPPSSSSPTLFQSLVVQVLSFPKVQKSYF